MRSAIGFRDYFVYAFHQANGSPFVQATFLIKIFYHPHHIYPHHLPTYFEENRWETI